MNKLLTYRAYKSDGSYIASSNDIESLINVPTKPGNIEHHSSSGEYLGFYVLTNPDKSNLLECYTYSPRSNAPSPSPEFIDPYDDTPLQVRTASKSDLQPKPLPPLHSPLQSAFDTYPIVKTPQGYKYLDEAGQESQHMYSSTGNAAFDLGRYVMELHINSVQAEALRNTAPLKASEPVAEYTQTVWDNATIEQRKIMADSVARQSITPAHEPVGLHVSIIDLQAIALSIQLQIRAQRKHDEALYNDDTINEHEWKARRYHNTVLSNTVQQMLSLAELKTVAAIVLDSPTTPTPAPDPKAHNPIIKHADMCGCVQCDPSGIV